MMTSERLQSIINFLCMVKMQQHSDGYYPDTVAIEYLEKSPDMMLELITEVERLRGEPPKRMMDANELNASLLIHQMIYGDLYILPRVSEDKSTIELTVITPDRVSIKPISEVNE